MHSIWQITKTSTINIITQIFNSIDNFYIADGHHRAAAASRVAYMRSQQNLLHTGNESYNYFLTVLYPHNQMKILEYNRIVSDLNGLDKMSMLNKIKKRFKVEKSNIQAKPRKRGEFGMYVDNNWYRLTIKEKLFQNSEQHAALDVSLLTKHILEPILGITDLRRDKRIKFIGGIKGLDELECKVNSGQMAVAFALYPTSMEQLLAVANCNNIMPPKSTWFEPKLADGLISHLLD